jgi:hypothetical protein
MLSCLRALPPVFLPSSTDGLRRKQVIRRSQNSSLRQSGVENMAERGGRMKCLHDTF